MSKNPREILDVAARTRVPDNVNLYPRIAAQLGRKNFLRTLYAKPLFLILSIIFSLALLSGVAYALGRSLGYIRGVGMVENNQDVRILPKTVEVSQDGISLRVLSLTADSTQTILTYRVNGIPEQMDTSHPKCTEAPALQLPNGKRLEAISQPNSAIGGENGVLSFDARTNFPPIPVDVEEVTLLTPCQLPLILIRLVPAPSGMVLPATEIPATFDSSHSASINLSRLVPLPPRQEIIPPTSRPLSPPSRMAPAYTSKKSSKPKAPSF